MIEHQLLSDTTDLHWIPMIRRSRRDNQRKLLLSGAAMLMATMGVASAQVASNPMQGQMVAPSFPGASANDSNSFLGQPDTYVGNKTGFLPVPAPQPGTVVVKLGGKVEADFGGVWSPLNSSVSPPGSAKVNPLSIAAYARLYPGVDGMATNGLRYGAQVEIRENFPGSSAQQTPLLSPAPSGSTYSSGETLYVRRAYAYVAADNLGIVRIGQGDGVIGLFDPCIFSGQCYDAGVANLNGGDIQSVDTPGLNVPFVWLAQAGAEYGNSKIVYLSPQLMGFDFGVQYAPSMGNGFSACGVTAVGGGVAQQASTFCNAATTGGDPTRWYNQVVAGVRYQGIFGPIGIGAYAAYETAGKEDFFGTPVTQGHGVTGTKYDNLSFVNAAFYLNYDTGFGTITPAFDFIGGAVNGQLAMRPTGGVSEQGFLPSLKYANGPLALEVEAGIVNSQGAQALTGVSQRHEFELGFGGSYVVAPGMVLVAEYLYQARHQAGFDFATGTLGAGSGGAPGTAGWHAGLTRDVHGQGVMGSLVVAW